MPITPFTSQQLIPQEEKLEVQKHKSQLFIGIPKETCYQERRICLTPDAVASLTSHGHRVLLESGAGLSASYTDREYSEAGAEIKVRARSFIWGYERNTSLNTAGLPYSGIQTNGGDITLWANEGTHNNGLIYIADRFNINSDNGYNPRDTNKAASQLRTGGGDIVLAGGEDTDNDGTVDVLDADSDNDGLQDVAERGDGQPTSVTATTDSDGDGLLDIFEGGDAFDGFDANDENRTAGTLNLGGVPALLADGSNAVPLVTDLHFRDVNDSPVAADDAFAVAEDAAPTVLGRMFGSRPRPPRSATPTAGNLTRTLYVLEAGQPVPLQVTAGISDGRRTEISGEGLREGLPIITELRSGAAGR